MGGADPEQSQPEAQRVGRFQILRRIGHGGMGLVYSAYDEELDRRVAIKLIRHADPAGELAMRMRREAMAMAKLSHPNVAAVYDVGLHNDQLFIAMEYVQGHTLRRWLDEVDRSTAEILDVHLQAAQGLHAAHVAGLVHRDFKPDNAMIGRDGRVRVLDFGLARRHGVPAPDEEQSAPEADVGSELTQQGAVVGTPGYMSPEQYLGEEAGPRSDQFSLCVSLYESLYGQRPFAGRGRLELASAVARGELREPPPRHGVPRRITDALLRGLAANPNARWPTMTSLIDALEWDPTQHRRRWLGRAAIGALSVALVVLVAERPEDPAAHCDQGSQRLGRELTQRETTVADAMRAAAPHGESTWAQVRPTLEAYADDWSRVWSEACRGSAPEASADESLADRTMVCLARRRESMNAVLDVLAMGDATVVARARDAVDALPSISDCEDPDWLLARVPLPLEADRRAEAQRLQGELTSVLALSRVGATTQALARCQPLVVDAEALGHADTLARIVTERGHLEVEEEVYATGVEDLRRGFFLAQEAGNRETAVEAAAMLGRAYGTALADAERGREWLTHAKALAAGIDLSPELEDTLVQSEAWVAMTVGEVDRAVELLDASLERCQAREPEGQCPAHHYRLAKAYFEAGRYDETVEHSELAIAAGKRRDGEDSPGAVAMQAGLIEIYAFAGRHTQARATVEMSRDALARVFGPESPWLTELANSEAYLLATQGDFGAAVAKSEEALAMAESRETPPRVMLAVLGGLANRYFRAGRYQEQAAAARRALTLATETYGDAHPMLMGPQLSFALATFELADYDQAREAYRRHLELVERFFGARHRRTAESLQGIAGCDYMQERYEPAIAAMRRAVAVLEEAQLVPTAKLGSAYKKTAMVLRELGRHGEAVELLERLVETYVTEYGAPSPNVANARLELGRTLLSQGQPDDARTELIRALETFERLERQQPDVPRRAEEVARARFRLAQAMDRKDGDEARALARGALVAAPPNLRPEIEAWLAK